MPPARSHSQNRVYVCTCCGNKTPPKHEVKGSLLALYKIYVSDEFDPQILSNPTGLCQLCKKNLYKLREGETVSDSTLQTWLITSERLKLLPRFRGINIYIICKVTLINI